MQSRIDKVIDCLKGLRPDQIDGKDDAKVTVTIGGQPQELSGQNYLYHFAILQVQFHATTAYEHPAQHRRQHRQARLPRPAPDVRSERLLSLTPASLSARTPHAGRGLIAQRGE